MILTDKNLYLITYKYYKKFVKQTFLIVSIDFAITNDIRETPYN